MDEEYFDLDELKPESSPQPEKKADDPPRENKPANKPIILEEEDPIEAKPKKAPKQKKPKKKKMDTEDFDMPDLKDSEPKNKNSKTEELDVPDLETPEPRKKKKKSEDFDVPDLENSEQKKSTSFFSILLFFFGFLAAAGSITAGVLSILNTVEANIALGIFMVSAGLFFITRLFSPSGVKQETKEKQEVI
ncbi:hypothetical protein CHISP_2027 [Chitinispirillum alkaliphilum]|nr:hypothetical protein CHISP_2027 [Chitinispirillum alkaliphilum]